MFLWALQTYLYSEEFLAYKTLMAGAEEYPISFYTDLSNTCFSDMGIEAISMELIVTNTAIPTSINDFCGFTSKEIRCFVTPEALNSYVLNRISDELNTIESDSKSDNLLEESLLIELVDNKDEDSMMVCVHPLCVGCKFTTNGMDVSSLRWDISSIFTVSQLIEVQELKKYFTGIHFSVRVVANSKSLEGGEFTAILEELMTYKDARRIELVLRKSLSSEEVICVLDSICTFTEKYTGQIRVLEGLEHHSNIYLFTSLKYNVSNDIRLNNERLNNFQKICNLFDIVS